MEKMCFMDTMGIIGWISVSLSPGHHSPRRESSGMLRRDPHIVRLAETIRTHRAPLHPITTQSGPNIGKSLSTVHGDRLWRSYRGHSGVVSIDLLCSPSET